MTIPPYESAIVRPPKSKSRRFAERVLVIWGTLFVFSFVSGSLIALADVGGWPPWRVGLMIAMIVTLITGAIVAMVTFFIWAENNF